MQMSLYKGRGKDFLHSDARQASGKINFSKNENRLEPLEARFYAGKTLDSHKCICIL